MIKKSLGLIEVVGLAAALEAADAAVKAANVTFVGYEFTKGGGLVLVKLCGDVGAVKAGVEAGSMAASKVNKVFSTLVIPRPHQQLSCMLESAETVVVKEKPTPIVVIESQVIGNEDEMIEELGVEPELVDDTEMETKEQSEVEMEVEVQVEREEDNLDEEGIETPPREVDHENSEGDDVIVRDQLEKQQADVCNLCNDPVCHRKKGDPKITCIYYGRNN